MRAGRAVTHYRDRAHAGQVLAERLAHLAGRDDVVVLALPRGGVPVGAELARALGAPLDVLVVRKIGVPGHEELAMGAVVATGHRVLNADVVRRAGVSPEVLDAATAAQRAGCAQREASYREGRPPLPVEGRTVVVVDDGLATGATMRAALETLRQRGPARVVVAVPVAPRESLAELAALAADVVCPSTPVWFRAVSQGYADFRQTSDDEVRALLADSGG